MTTDNAIIDGQLHVGGKAAIGGDAVIGGDVTVQGWLRAPNIAEPFKGVFASSEYIERAFPRPENGWWAVVPDNEQPDTDVLHGHIYTAWEAHWNMAYSGGAAINVAIDTFGLVRAMTAAFITPQVSLADINKVTDTLADGRPVSRITVLARAEGSDRVVGNLEIMRLPWSQSAVSLLSDTMQILTTTLTLANGRITDTTDGRPHRYWRTFTPGSISSGDATQLTPPEGGEATQAATTAQFTGREGIWSAWQTF